MDKQLGSRLKEARLNKGFSQSDVAVKINISRQAISRWENNTSYPDIENLVYLSEYYDVSMDELLMGQKQVPIEKKWKYYSNKWA